MKYVMFQCKSEGKPTLHLPVVFPEVLTHKDVAEAIEHVKCEPAGPFSSWWMWPKAVSAGFLRDNHCFGESESLKMKAHHEDTKICESFLGARGGLGFQEREVKDPRE